MRGWSGPGCEPGCVGPGAGAAAQGRRGDRRGGQGRGADLDRPRLSAGIAHNKMLAKLVSGLHKPDDQTTLPAGVAAKLVSPLPVRALPGVGHGAERELVEPRPAARDGTEPPWSRCASPVNATLSETSK